MDILIIQNYFGKFTGVITSIIDTYMNLQHHIGPENVRLVTTWSKVPHWGRPWSEDWEEKWIKICRDNKNFGSIRGDIVDSFHGDVRLFGADLIICSSRFLIDVINEGFEIYSDRLIVLDSMDIHQPKYRSYRNLDDAVWTDNCIWLCNPANMGITKYKEYEYYHKFNSDRLETIKFKNEPFYYSREKKYYINIEKGKYFENIGKGIWERVYHNIPVYYDTKGMYMRDGLYYYLKLFGIDGEKDHRPLPLYSEVDRVAKEIHKIVKNKLLMKKDDLLLELL